MTTATVSITFEATSKTDAESKMAAWFLHEGCKVNATFTEQDSTFTGVIDSEGNLVPPDLPPVPGNGG